MYLSTYLDFDRNLGVRLEGGTTSRRSIIIVGELFWNSWSLFLLHCFSCRIWKIKPRSGCHDLCCLWVQCDQIWRFFATLAISQNNLVNVLRVNFVCGILLNLLWRILYAIGLIFADVNGQILKINQIAIWSHCLRHNRRRPENEIQFGFCCCGCNQCDL